jgi:capsular exopolysaccharide synthesis family protein
MAEQVSFIERVAHLLRQPPTAHQPADAVAGAVPQQSAPLDLGELARRGIPLPAVERSRAVEEFRLIKRNLIGGRSRSEAAGDRIGPPSIMVASARSGEGKTFVAISLALAFAAETGGEALLVDIDTSHSLLESYFGRRASTGLVDVLEGHQELADAVIATTHPKLSILPAGRGGPNVPELLASERMPALLAEMTAHHPNRVIVIDTPPCLASSDAATLAPMVGQIVLVVEAHRTQRQEIESSLALLGGGRQISLLLNKCDRTTSEHFGSYGYDYRYRKSDEPPAAAQD